MSKYQRTSKYEIRQTIKPRIAPLTAAVGGALAAGSLQAATITVDTLDDSLGTASQCTLRAALYAATNNDPFDGCAAGETGEDTVIFDSSLSGTIALQAGTGLNFYDGSTLTVGESVVIDGDGDITLQGTGDAPVFYSKYDSGAGYNTQSLTLYGLTITGGGGAEGGGILSRGLDLSLNGTTITGNTASTAGGGVWHKPYGGAGSLYMLASTISGNSVTGAGGVAGGVGMRTSTSTQVEILGTSFYNNEAVSGDGGGLYLDTEDISFVEIKYNQFDQNTAGGRGGGALLDLGYAQVSVSDTDFTGNSATGDGGGLYLSEDFDIFQRAEILFEGTSFVSNSAGGSGGGAAINVRYGGDGTLSDPVKFVEIIGESQFNDNAADVWGGGLFLNLDDTVVGRIESTDFNGNNSEFGGGGLRADVNASEITIQNSGLINNSSASGRGGGVEVSVTDGAFYGRGLFAVSNSAGSGAAVRVDADASDFGMEYSTFFSNIASGCGGGVRVDGTPNEIGIGHSIFAGNSGSCGGAVTLFAPSAGGVFAELKYNEMSSNYATSTSTTGGGAIFADLGSGSTAFVKNSTISDNSSDGLGGGIRLRGDMSGEIKYTTVADNYAYDSGGGIYSSISNCSIDNTILGGNTDDSGAYQDLSGSYDCEVSNSLLAGAKYSDYSDGGGNIVNVAPDLEPLADNGGNAGWTHALQPGSPALDAGSAGSSPPDYDQRGPAFPRIQGSAIDMGAYEVGPPIDELFQDRFEQP